MKSFTKGAKVSTRKVRLVADAIRNQTVSDALALLSVTPKHGAYVLEKAIHSAVANSKMSADQLTIAELLINEGQFLKRFRASTRGRIHPYKKRTTHITVVLKEKEIRSQDSGQVKVQPVKKVETKTEGPKVVEPKSPEKSEKKESK